MMPTDNEWITFDTGTGVNFDVLEILSYPEGLDGEGVPLSVDLYPLCGPQATESCQDLAWGDSGVRIPLTAIETAIANTEYYAIGGIMLPMNGSPPDSFMVLLRNEQAKESE